VFFPEYGQFLPSLIPDSEKFFRGGALSLRRNVEEATIKIQNIDLGGRIVERFEKPPPAQAEDGPSLRDVPQDTRGSFGFLQEVSSRKDMGESELG
jgi:hypothetical protein